MQHTLYISANEWVWLGGNSERLVGCVQPENPEWKGILSYVLCFH